MEEKYYLHLGFTSAALKYEYSTQPTNKRSFSTMHEHLDMKHPIGRSQVSGMLHALFGYAPVPKNRTTCLEKVDEIEKLVDNTWIRFGTYRKIGNEAVWCETDSQNQPNICNETFCTNKAAYNSHATIETFIDGKKFNIFLSWKYFRKTYASRLDAYDEVIGFLKKLCGDDFMSRYTMSEFVTMFHKEYVDRKEVKEFLDVHYQQRGANDNSYFRVLFKLSEHENCANRYNSKTPLLNASGVGCKISYDGEFIITFENPELVDRLKKFGKLPTLLDGGVVRVISLEQYEPYFDFEDKFEKVINWTSKYVPIERKTKK